MMANNDRTMNVVKGKQEGKREFSLMHLLAWGTLAIGLVLCLWNVNHFSDANMTLMLGIGFMVASVFIYTIGTAIHLVEERKRGQDTV